MKSILQYQLQEYELQRYPGTTDKSLQAWSNAELLALDYCKDKNVSRIHLYNDRFGVWNCTLHDKEIITVWTYTSQQKAIIKNLAYNQLLVKNQFKTPLEALESVDLALIKVPKSLALFELFLQQIYNAATEYTEVVCCFMTRNFTPAILKIAELYFEGVEQSKAWKKARLLVLTKPRKNVELKKMINTILFRNTVFKQYYGVFSSDRIDIGTQFFIENLKVLPSDFEVLDLASGNGVIAHEVQQQNTASKVTLVDDFNLAIDSSKMNVVNEKAHFICADTLEELASNQFDLVVSNPPFHFEYENNIDVTVSLFLGVKKCLKPTGRFLLVANKHLNYKTHLLRIFTEVKEVKSNSKFIIYECK